MKTIVKRFVIIMLVLPVFVLFSNCNGSGKNGDKKVDSTSVTTNPPPSFKMIGENTIQINIEGVRIGPQKPDETGPFVSRRVDLEKGREGTPDSFDMDLFINARQEILAINFKNGTKLGKSKVTIDELAQVLENGQFLDQAQCHSFPSGYFGLKTRSGHLNQFRIRAIHKKLVDPAQRKYNIRVEIENKAWKQI